MNGIKKTYSVVVCSYNKLYYIKQVAEKLKKLRPENEIILSDDFSTDGTIEWARDSGIFSKIRVESAPGNYRLNTVRNSGIELASNDFVVLLDADCLPDDSYFVGHDILFNGVPDAVSIGITRFYNSDGTVLKTDDRRLGHCGNDKFKKCGWEMCYGGNVAFKKSLWNSVGKFDEEYNGCWGFEDLDFSIRLYKKSVSFYLSVFSSVRHLEHPVCKSSTDASNGNCRNAVLFEKKHGIKML